MSTVIDHDNPTQVVNIRVDKDYDIYIGRSKTPEVGRWGNPYDHKPGRSLAQYRCSTREESIEKYEKWLQEAVAAGDITLSQLASLYGKRLGCFCAPKPCHGHVLARYADMAARILNQRG